MVKINVPLECQRKPLSITITRNDCAMKVTQSPTREAKTSAKSPFFAPVIQPKLTVNTPGDAYEQEADRIADQVMRMKDGDAPVVQRKCAKCEREEQAQRKEAFGASGGFPAPSIVQQTLARNNGGQPLDADTRQFMESRFGQDFSQVRIHTDTQAAHSAAAIQARAYTSGQHIVFGQGQYQPSSDSGRRLLAHELVHVGQQEHAERQIQRDGLEEEPIVSLHYRYTFGGRRGADRHEIYAGGPRLPIIGHPAAGVRFEDGRAMPIAGVNPMEPGSEMYSLEDARSLLRSRGGTPAQGCPLHRISPVVGCCPIGQVWNSITFRCEVPPLPHIGFPSLPYIPPLQTPGFQLPRRQGLHLISPQQLQLNPTQSQTNATVSPVTDVSAAGLQFIGRFEGLRLQRYNDTAGHCTIGYGHLVHRGPCTDADYPNGITQEEALRLLRTDAANAVAAVGRQITVPLTQTQFDAVVSFIFNVGVGAFSRSTLRSRINQGANSALIRAAFLMWNRAGGRVLAGLTRRRNAEADLFINGTY